MTFKERKTDHISQELVISQYLLFSVKLQTTFAFLVSFGRIRNTLVANRIILKELKGFARIAIRNSVDVGKVNL